ncbi:MAG: aminotransferase class III-fold pyridoxal phosphate-dependent enzyme, partial [Myxococcota bacterium]
IVDDIQTGCGRTGTFFSFESAGITPDIICLSKSLSGIGLPLSIVLLAPEHDLWQPGEHNGTFRGNNLAFVTARAALDFWHDTAFLRRLDQNIAYLDQRLRHLLADYDHFAVKGRGMIRGIDVADRALAARIRHQTFLRGVILETCGPEDTVLKLLPPLTIDRATLDEGLAALAHGLATTRDIATRGSATPRRSASQRP